MNIIRVPSFWDYVFFILSASIVAGVLVGLKDMNYVTLAGYGLAIFWMFVALGFRGALKALHVELAIQLERNKEK